MINTINNSLEEGEAGLLLRFNVDPKQLKKRDQYIVQFDSPVSLPYDPPVTLSFTPDPPSYSIINSKEINADKDNLSSVNKAIDSQAATTRNDNGKDLVEKKDLLNDRYSANGELLIDRKDEVVSRNDILQHVWGYDVYPSTRTIDNFILAFRRYFEPDPKEPKYFQSIRSVGYKFECN
jgi:hypothetical protein